MKPNRHKWTVALALLAFACLPPAGQAVADVVDFDDLTLAPDSFWEGPDPLGTNVSDPFGDIRVGSFTSGDTKFVNRYHLTFELFTGFAYSNVTDNTTDGYMNQHSAFTGTGHGPGADNYGVAFGYVDDLNPNDPGQLDQLPWFELPAGAQLQSAYVTNTTYPALIMRDGDVFALSKKFGGETGTDDDWFRLTAYGADASGTFLGTTVEFYLADYRGDAEQDYIVDTWTFWDLSALAGAQRVYFDFDSSDAGENGMNTPAFFAIDDIEFTMVPEPASWLTLALGGALVALVRRRRRR